MARTAMEVISDCLMFSRVNFHLLSGGVRAKFVLSLGCEILKHHSTALRVEATRVLIPF